MSSRRTAGCGPTSWSARPRASPRSCPGMRRDVAPVYSLMVATEPLPDDVLGADRAGASARRSATSGTSSSTGSAPPTAGSRSAAAARRTTSARGSGRSTTATPTSSPRCTRCSSTCCRPSRGAAFTHAWGGPLGIARDWCASVGLDRATGLAWAGGYVGDGVVDDQPGRPHPRRPGARARTPTWSRLPWVDHRSRRWEPEPLRWLGVSAALTVMGGADAEEARTGRPSRRAALLERFTGH